MFRRQVTTIFFHKYFNTISYFFLTLRCLTKNNLWGFMLCVILVLPTQFNLCNTYIISQLWPQESLTRNFFLLGFVPINYFVLQCKEKERCIQKAVITNRLWGSNVKILHNQVAFSANQEEIVEEEFLIPYSQRTTFLSDGVNGKLLAFFRWNEQNHRRK